MKYKMIEKPPFKIIGKGIQVSTVNGENLKTIPAFWDEANKSGFSNELAKICGPMGLLGVCMQFNHEKQEFTYFIGAEKTIETLPADWQEIDIPSVSWAVFEAIGPMPGSIQKVWKKNLFRLVPVNRVRTC